MTSQVESFLRNFHDMRPGITARAYSALPVQGVTAGFASSYESLAERLVPGVRSVLDVACGDAYFLSLLAHRLPHTVRIGIDLSHGELRAATQSGALLCQGRAQRLPLAAGCIDAVTSHMALMLMNDLDAVLSEIHRVLRVNGQLCFIIGAAPPKGQPVLETYLRHLRALRAQEPAAALRFGDPRLAHPDGIRDTLQPAFDAIEINTLTLHRRYTPAQLWGWFDGMYDLSLHDLASQRALKTRYLSEIESLRDTDGMFTITNHLREVIAVRR